jgi:hypothetical protein
MAGPEVRPDLVAALAETRAPSMTIGGVAVMGVSGGPDVAAGPAPG